MTIKTFILVFSLLASNILNPTFVFTQQKSKKELKNEQKLIEEKIKYYKARQNKDIYLGIASLPIVNKEQQNIEQEVRKNALNNLASSIRIKIKTTIKDELKYTTATNIEQKFEMITNMYTTEVLNRVITEVFHNYPKKGWITAVCYISVVDYEKTVQEEIRKNIAQISKYAVEGIKALNEKLVLTALENFIAGKKKLNECFYDLPALEDIDNDGKPDDLYAFFDTNILKIINNIKIEPITENVVYTTDGKIKKYPVVRILYTEKDNRIPVEGIKLSIKFLQGYGTGEILPQPLVSNKLGEVQIPVHKVDPSYKRVIIQVQLDPQMLNIDEKQYPLPYCIITINKKKVFAYCVKVQNGNKTISYKPLVNSLKSILQNMGCDTIEYQISNAVNKYIIFDLAQKKVDYFLIIYITTTGGKVGDYNMYYSIANSEVEIYSLPEGDIIVSLEGPTSHGYGTTTISAANIAIEKIKNELLQKIVENVKKLN